MQGKQHRTQRFPLISFWVSKWMCIVDTMRMALCRMPVPQTHVPLVQTDVDNVYREYQSQLFLPHVVAWEHSPAETSNQHYLTVYTQLYIINLPPHSALYNKHTEFSGRWCISIRGHGPPDPGFPIHVSVISSFPIAWVSSVRSILKLGGSQQPSVQTPEPNGNISHLNYYTFCMA